MEKLKPKLRFPEFKDQWFQKKLGDVFSITSASRVHKNEWKDKGVRFFRTSDVISHYKGTDNIKAFISFELYETLSNKIGRVNKNDLLITGGGSIGIPYLISNDEPLYFKDADLLWIKNVDEINGFFLYTFFLTEYFRDYLNSISHTGTIAHYTVNQAKNTPFNFPSLPEQTKIASFLSTVDEKLNLLKEKKAALEEYKKGMMQKIFSQEIRFKPAPSNTSGDENGNGFAEWEEKMIADICVKIQSGGTPKSTNRNYYEGQIPFLSISDMTKQGKYITYTSNRISEDGLNNSSSWIVPENSLIYSMYASVGFVAINKIPLATSQAVLNLILKENICLDFVYYYLVDFQKYLAEYITTGTQGNLNAQSVKSFKIPIPSLEEQTKIASFLSAIDEKIALVSKQIEETQAFKKGLLQQMFC